MRSPIVLADRINRVHYAIRDIVQRANKVKASGKKLVPLNIGDPNVFDFQPPAHVTQAIIEALKNPKYSGYAPSEGDAELREAAAARENKMGGTKIVANDVFITSGLSEGIDFLIQATVNPGENWLLPNPPYPLYVTKIAVNGGEDSFYDCDPKSWQPDLDDLRTRISKKTKAVAVINPNNPTGAVYERKTLQGIVDLAGEHDLPLIADEIYNQMVFDAPANGKGPGADDPASGLPGSIPLASIAKDVPCISGNGVSKNYLYPGARVGYLAFHAADGELDGLKAAVQKLCNARLSVNWEMQRGAIAAFNGPHAHVPGTLAKLRERGTLLHKRINNIPGLSLVKPRAAFYAFAQIEESAAKKAGWKTDTDFVHGLLDETGVVCVPGSGFSKSLPGKFFRMVFLPQPEVINDACDKIEAYVKKKTGK